MTALIGLKFPNGVLLTADRRITYRNTTNSHDTAKKIILLNKNIMLAYAGTKNIVDKGIGQLKNLSALNSSTEKIIEKSQEILSSAQQWFNNTYPGEDDTTLYILAGLNDENQPFISYFSSDDYFKKKYSLNFFSKAVPEGETKNLQDFLENNIDFSKTNIDYYVTEFSRSIRNITDYRVGNTTYSILLSTQGIYELEVNESGQLKFKEVDYEKS